MKRLLILVYSGMSSFAHAQSDSSSSPISFSGYIDTYYTYDFGNPANHKRSGFIYSFDRHNEVNLNLGFIKAAWQKNNVRANLALATGTYMNANLAAEPGVLKNIFEANAGVKLSKKANLWLDAGIFASHIGFESAVSKDCWGLTRSILADNTPYYESGAKVSYTSGNNKWMLSGLILNGWQHIQRPDGNNTPAVGTQITFTPNAKITVNYSTFIGNDKPDTARLMRYFNNFYGIFHLTDKLYVTAGFDYGIEQKSKRSSSFNNWYSPVLIAKVILGNKCSVTGRAEYYVDKNEVIISTGTANGFQTYGSSLNFDYRITDNAMWRIELRTLASKDKIFNKNGDAANTNAFVTTSLAVSF